MKIRRWIYGMNRKAMSVLLLALFSMTAAWGDDDDETGTLRGKLSTDYRGGAIYAIKLQVPPGTATLQPELTVFYHSHLSNGLMGMGFGLGGMSAIQRCNATLAQNGYNAAVSYGTRDRLCMDGVQLKAVQGSYWAPGSVYHTEKETWARITAEADGSFVVHQRDGQTFVYGGRADARIVSTANPNAVRVWALSEVRDLNGNRMVIRYSEGQIGSGQYLPTLIEYTLNDAVPDLARRQVRFSYDFTRTDVEFHYIGGGVVRDTARLKEISTYLIVKESKEVKERQVGRYSFGYGIAPATGRSRLVEMKECTADGRCLPAQQFVWQDGSPNVTSPKFLGAYSFGQGKTTKVWRDFNNDGRPDLMVASQDDQGGAWVVYGEPGGLSRSSQQLASIQCAGGATQWLDFNADGYVDLTCTPNSGDYRHWVMLSNGKELQSPLQLGTRQCDDGAFHWPDFNGDGLPDLLCDQTTGGFRHTLAKNTGRGLDNPVAIGTFGVADALLDWVDTNGDRMEDLVVSSHDERPQHWLLLSNGRTLDSPRSLGGFGDADSVFNWADLNSDGLPDMIADRTKPPFSHAVRLSTGTSITPERALGIFPSTGPDKIEAFVWRDFNGDGMADLLCCEEIQESQGWSVLLSGGDALRSAAPLPNTRFALRGGESVWSDFSADGLLDLMVVPEDASGDVLQLDHQPAYPDLLIGIANGIGGTIKLRYAPITDPAVYSVDAATVPGDESRELHGPIYVLAHKENNDGRLNPNTYAYDYRYSGSRLDLQGRGWLGFRQVMARDLATSVETRSLYGLSFPQTGLLLEEHVVAVTGKTERALSSESHEYIVDTPFAEVAQVLAADSRLTLYGKQGVAGLARVTSRHIDYDSYGNEILIHQRDDSGTGSDAYICRTLRNVTGAQGAYVLGLVEQETESSGCRFDAKTQSCQCDDTLRQSRREFSTDGTYSVVANNDYFDTQNSWLTIRYGYDAVGNVNQIDNPAKGLLRLTYDDDFKTFPVLTENALGYVTRSRYDAAFGIPVWEQDENGNVRASTVDGFGRITERWGPAPDGSTQRLVVVSWESEGKPSKGGVVYAETRSRIAWDQGDPKQWPVSRAYYDGLNRDYRTEHNAPGQLHPILNDREFDAEARVKTQSTDYWQGDTRPTITMVYDDHGRLARTESAVHRATLFDYDVVAVPTQKGNGATLQKTTVRGAGTDAARRSSSLISAQGGLMNEQFADGTAVRYTLDPLERLLRIESPNGVYTAIGYNSLDLQTNIASSENGTLKNVFYANGLLQHQTDTQGNSISLEYDVLGRVVRKEIRAAQKIDGVPQQRTTTYRYDEPVRSNPIGNLTSAQVTADGEPIAAYAFGYDADGRKTDQWVTVGGETYREQFTYDAGGRLIDTVHPDGGVVRRTYTPEGFLHQVLYRVPGGSSFEAYATYSGYTATGQPGTISLKNGLEIERSYDADDLVIAERISLGGLLTDQRYEWNAARELTAITQNKGSRGNVSLEYFDQGYLKSAERDGRAWTFAYDPAGNITTRNDQTFSYDGQHLMAGKHNGQTFLQLRYDAAGNPISRTVDGETWNYAYDGEGRLLRAEVGGAAIRFSYGLEGHRIERRDVDGTLSRYVFPDWEVTQLPDDSRLVTGYIEGIAGRIAAVTYDTAAGATGDGRRGTTTSGLVPGPNGPGIPVAGRLFFASDYLDSVALVSDEKGAMVSRLFYQPYGAVEQIESSGEDIFRAKYVRSERDPGTGFYYMYERYQDPLVGRFLTPDNRPVGGKAESAAAFNHYAYAGNSPYSLKDPNGAFFVIDDVIEVSAVISAAAAATAEAAEAVAVAGEVSAAVASAGAVVSTGAEVAEFGVASASATAGLAGSTELAALSVETTGAAVVDLAAVDAAGAEGAANLVGTAIEGSLATDAVSFAANPAVAAEAGLVGEAGGGGMLESIAVQAGYADEASIAVTEESLPELGEAQGVGRGVAQSGFEETSDSSTANPLLDDASCDCFPEGTLVRGADGPVAVENIRLGDRIWSYNAVTGDTVLKPVIGLVHKVVNQVVEITLGENRLTVTPDHAFWLEGEGWRQAATLRQGDRLRGIDGTLAEVTGVAPHPGPVTVFTLEVSDTHSFYVGLTDTLSHNVCQLRGHWGYRQRLERVRARVRPRDLGTGTGTTQRTRTWVRMMARLDGYFGRDDAGHPIARALGGPGHDTRYIFPQLPRINRGVFRVYEAQVRDAVRRTGRSVVVRIQLLYRNVTSTRPYQVIYRYRLSGSNLYTQRIFGN